MRSRCPLNRLCDLAEAVARIEDGSHVSLGGFAITRCVTAAAREIVRSKKRNLILSQVIGGMDTDIIVGGGCARKLIYSGGSLDRFGPLHSVNRAILDGQLEVEEYSSLALMLRFLAGALGLPFIPSRAMLGSDLLAALAARGDAVRYERDPFTDSPVVAVAPIQPDVAIVHVDVADEEGNCTLSGPRWSIRETALAGKHTIVLAEEVVAAGTLDPDHVVVPSGCVDSVVHAPAGAHPTAVYGMYDYDRAHIELYVERARLGSSAYSEYLDQYVYSAGSHAAYLELVHARA